MATADFVAADLTSLSTLIAATATRLRSLTQRSQQDQWHHCWEPISTATVLENPNWQRWPIAPLNARGHIAWPQGQRSLWLCQQFTVPKAFSEFSLEGLSLRLGLTWWAEAVKVYVKGELVQEGDLFDYFARILLSDLVAPGDSFTVAIHLLSPSHDDGALVRSEVIYEARPGTSPDPGFVADELIVLRTYAEKLAPEKLKDLAAAIAPLDWSVLANRASFQAELEALRQRLMPLSGWIKQRRIACVGHAHLDLAWLWPVEDTWRAAERTFKSVLSLQESFPELTYTHSSPALFDWLETHKPELFTQVVQAVKSGTWSIDAGLWVEPELNIIGGESLARQILYGQRYSRSRFGQASAIAWLPDSFGFSWQLPQLFRQGGIQCFATQKLRWNDTTLFPHSLFQWEGLDGTQILSLMLPPIGSDIEPAKMAEHAAEWEIQTGSLDTLWLPGMGDHGGGPTRDMLEKARRWSDSPFFPQLTFTAVVNHLQTLLPTSPFPHSPLPVWQNELYLELHRGCYTVHADQKWFNHHCEQTLVEAELFAAVATLQGGFDYPKADLETAWKRVLFNQFHDILPGTAIPEVFETANLSWQAAYHTAQNLRSEALSAIAHQIPLPSSPHAAAIPLFVFNSLNWQRTEMVAVDLASLPVPARTWGVFDPETGNPVLSQLSQYSGLAEAPPCEPTRIETDSAQLLFLAQVPSVGYRLFWLVPNPEATLKVAATKVAATVEPAKEEIGWQLENDWLRAVIDPSTGDLTELWEKSTQTAVVRSPANQLQAFQDAGQYWDAWNIAPDYANHPLPPTQLKSIEWLERGPLRQRLRVLRELGPSIFQQDYVLDQHVPYLKVVTVADWQASQVVLKAAFPVTFETDHATFEIPFGAIARPTAPTDPHEKAKWEVPALRWADLSDEQIGLSILTDYKHGFDTQPQQLRLTLLKAPLWPDPNADRGRHSFTYALYPHPGNWQQGKTPNWAIAFNTPLQSLSLPPIAEPISGVSSDSSPAKSFLSLGPDTAHLAAFKQAEADSSRYVLRCWDLYGQGTTLDITALGGKLAYQRTNLLEDALSEDSPEQLTPWQIATLQLDLSDLTRSPK